MLDEDEEVVLDKSDNSLWVFNRWKAQLASRRALDFLTQQQKILSELLHVNIRVARPDILRTTDYIYWVQEYCHYGSLESQFDR